LEQRIFAYYWTEVRSKIGPAADQPVRFDCLFPPTAYRFAIRNQTSRDDFNACLQAIRVEGVYDRIIERYTSGAVKPDIASQR